MFECHAGRIAAPDGPGARAPPRPPNAGDGDDRSPLTTGLAAGQWCAYGLGKIAPELPLDQRHDDAGSLVYDSEPLNGGRSGRVPGRAPAGPQRPPAGQVAVRLNDVHPDGAVERLTYGVSNLCHRDGHAHPEAMAVRRPLRHRGGAEARWPTVSRPGFVYGCRSRPVTGR